MPPGIKYVNQSPDPNQAPLPQFPTGAQGQVANMQGQAAPPAVAVASPSPSPSPSPPWGAADYANAAADTGLTGLGAYMARGQIADAAKGAMGLVSKVPVVGRAAAALGGLPAALIATAPLTGTALGGALGGAAQTFTNPIGPGARQWAADTQANTNAEGLAKLGTAGLALFHAGKNALQGAGYGMQAAFSGDQPAAPAASALAPVSQSGDVEHPGAKYFQMAHNDFVKHLAGLTNGQLDTIMGHMMQMPKSTPAEQIMNQVSQAHTAKYMSDMAEADKEPDANKRALMKQKAVGEFTQSQRYLLTGAGSLAYELGNNQ